MATAEEYEAHRAGTTLVKADDMKHKLLTLDAARTRLATTEPLTAYGVAINDETRFKLDPEWLHGVDAIDGDGPVQAFVKLGGQEFQLSKAALLEATSIAGLPKAYVQKTPARFIEDQLNYWYRDGLSGKDFKMLVAGELGAAFTKESIKPFSNLRLLDETLDSIGRRYGDGEVLVDYKFNHSLQATMMRLIIPENVRVMERTGTDNDTWSVGIQIRNSLIGNVQTEFSGYLFRWRCANGAIDTHATSGAWSRKGGGQGEEDVYAWAREAVDGVLGGLESALDNVQAMVDVPVAGDTTKVLRNIFDHYKVPVKLRRQITDNMVDVDRLNMYEIMQAVTSVANQAELGIGDVEDLMRIGGDLAHTAVGHCGECRQVTTTF